MGEPLTTVGTEPKPAALLFGRLITAMVTPFTLEGGVDYGRAESLASELVESGSDGLVVCGTTGESPTLTWDEEYELFRVVQKAVAGRAKVIAGTGSNATAEAIAATQKAAKLGLDGSLQVVPYYNKPPQEGLYEHFRAIAEATPDLPMLLYNIPGRTGCKLEGATIERLAEIPNIVGIKEATGDLDLASQIRAHTPPEFAIYSGDDSLTLPLMAVGAQGVVSVASHLVGADIKQCLEAFVSGNVSQAQRLHLKLFPLFRALFWSTNPIPLKAALFLLGRDSGVVRSPLVRADEILLGRLRGILASLGLLSESGSA
ncbi:MAG: 4-hydroxy-tetrahydrodipicolinate synthase [Pseudanabaenaceae cyanobacterium]